MLGSAYAEYLYRGSEGTAYSAVEIVAGRPRACRFNLAHAVTILKKTNPEADRHEMIADVAWLVIVLCKLRWFA